MIFSNVRRCWLAMPLGAGMSYNIKKDKLAFGIGKCRLQQLTIILLFGVPLTAIFLNQFKY